MKIVAAALCIHGTIVSAPTFHSQLYACAFTQGLMPKPDMEHMTDNDWKSLNSFVQEGFLTDNNSFVDRHQAAQIAFESKQVVKPSMYDAVEGLHTPDIFN